MRGLRLLIYDWILNTCPFPATRLDIRPSSAPLLQPDLEEMVVPLHSSFTLTCRGGTKLVWDTPFHRVEQSQVDRGVFVSTITVDIATLMHTGYYTCQYSGNITEEAEASSIYIYVPGMNLGSLFASFGVD